MVEKKQKTKIDLREVLEKDLSLLQEYIEGFWDFLPIPVCEVNTPFNIINFGRKFSEFFGYPKEEIIGQNLEMFFRSKKTFDGLKKKVLKEGEVSQEEVIVLNKKGEEIPVSLSAKARVLEKEIISCFFGFVDLRQVKEKERELEEKIEELERFQKLAVGRELKMIALKEEIKELKEKLKRYQQE